jgi:hypothetical protein
MFLTNVRIYVTKILFPLCNMQGFRPITNAMIELLESLRTNSERWEKPWILSENGSGAHNAASKRSPVSLGLLNIVGRRLYRRPNIFPGFAWDMQYSNILSYL